MEARHLSQEYLALYTPYIHLIYALYTPYIHLIHRNEKSAEFGLVPSKAVYVRVFEDGTVLYSTRNFRMKTFHKSCNEYYFQDQGKAAMPHESQALSFRLSNLQDHVGKL